MLCCPSQALTGHHQHTFAPPKEKQRTIRRTLRHASEEYTHNTRKKRDPYMSIHSGPASHDFGSVVRPLAPFVYSSFPPDPRPYINVVAILAINTSLITPEPTRPKPASTPLTGATICYASSTLHLPGIPRRCARTQSNNARRLCVHSTKRRR